MVHLEDRTGAPVTIERDETGPINTYTVRMADGTLAGRADFVDDAEADDVRIFFHTEIDPAFGRRGLAGLLVRTAFADSIGTGLTVVPVCPLFAAHLREHGAQFRTDGGRYREPSRADLHLVHRAKRTAEVFAPTERGD